MSDSSNSGDSNFGLGFTEANYNRPRRYGIPSCNGSSPTYS